MATRTLDFTNVKEQSQFRPTHVEEGDYTARIVGFNEQAKKDDPSVMMWVFAFKLDGKSSGTYPYYCTLNEDALWKVRNLLVAAGISVPKSRMKVDPAKLVNKTVGVSMVDDEYNGQMKSVIDAVFPADDAVEDTGNPDTDDEEEEEPEEEPVKPARRKKAKPAPEPEPEEDEDDEEDEEEEPPPPPVKKRKGKKAPPPPPEDDEDDEDLDVDDDDL